MPLSSIDSNNFYAKNQQLSISLFVHNEPPNIQHAIGFCCRLLSESNPGAERSSVSTFQNVTTLATECDNARWPNRKAISTHATTSSNFFLNAADRAISVFFCCSLAATDLGKSFYGQPDRTRASSFGE